MYATYSAGQADMELETQRLVRAEEEKSEKCIEIHRALAISCHRSCNDSSQIKEPESVRTAECVIGCICQKGILSVLKMTR